MIRVRWDRAGRIGLLVVLAVVVGLYVQHTLSYLSTKRQSISSRRSSTGWRIRTRRWSASRSRSATPATIVKDARALGMVRPGERPYVITGLGGR